ncbi:MAG TPA: hypothetical protein VMJ75_03785 [Candidatus Acidoferrales bacterium]|nr:hypothetical protein [Candidatus Acidoferrales bacterium]
MPQPVQQRKEAEKSLETPGVPRFLAAISGGPVFAVLLAALAVDVWMPLLFRSFWVDEAGTYWMVHEGVAQSIPKTLVFPGQSILYSIIAAFFCFDGSPLRDFLLRIPSVIGIVLAAYFLFRIGETWIGRGAGLAAVALFIFHPDLTLIGYQARPYALAIGAVTASCWSLLEWDRNRFRKHLVLYLLASLLVFYLHYFFAAILAVHAIYVAYVALLRGRITRIWELFCAWCAIPLLSLPLVPHLRSLMRERTTMPYLHAPSIRDLTDYLGPSELLAGLLIAAVVMAFLYPRPAAHAGERKPELMILILAWWLVGPLLFFMISRATPMTVFVPRYLAFTYPGQALALTYLGYLAFGARGARVWALAGVLAFAANPLILTRWKNGKDELLPIIRLVRARPNVPVFFPSLLQQSLFYDWRAGNRPDSYLFAPLVAYPISNPLLPMPVAPIEEAKVYLSGFIDSRLTAVPEVLFVDKDDRWADWLKDQMSRAGYRAAVEPPAGNFTLYVFRR